MFNNYPYTDYHELNTDWIIGKIKNVETAEANTKQYAEDADAAKIAAEGARDDAVQAKEDAEGARDDAQAAEQGASDLLHNTINQMNVLQARVDNIIPDGTQTVGNTELLDIRVAYDGVIYDSAGNAVRGQFGELKDALIKFNNANDTTAIDSYQYSTSKVTTTDFDICTNTVGASNAAFSNGFTAAQKIHVSNLDVKGATTIRVRTVRAGLFVVAVDDIPLNADNTFDVDFDMEAGDELYVVWETGTIYYSGNTGDTFNAYSDYRSGSSGITVNYLVAFNVTYEAYDIPVLLNVNERLKKKNKVWLALGDSITTGQYNNNTSYVDYVTAFLDTSTIKEGHNGYTLEQLFINSASYDVGDTADIITIFAGTNDFNNDRLIGTIDDPYGMGATFYGVLNGIIPYYQNRYPTKNIILVTPLQRDYSGSVPGVPAGLINGAGIALNEYAEAIRQAGVKYGVPVIDLYAISGFCALSNIASLTVDGLHPNDTGHRMISNAFAKVINETLQIV